MAYRSYTAPPLLPDRSDIARRGAELWGNPRRRIAVARRMYALRLGEVLPIATWTPNTGLNINWLNDPNTALICVAILTAWLNSGINFLYFSAGLGNIDETIYERASVDGASSVQQFFSLTLPGLSPIMFYTLVVNIIQAFQSFGQIKILTEGGPNESTNVIVYSIYRDAFFNYRFGSAADPVGYPVCDHHDHHTDHVPY